MIDEEPYLHTVGYTSYGGELEKVQETDDWLTFFPVLSFYTGLYTVVRRAEVHLGNGGAVHLLKVPSSGHNCLFDSGSMFKIVN